MCLRVYMCTYVDAVPSARRDVLAVVPKKLNCCRSRHEIVLSSGQVAVVLHIYYIHTYIGQQQSVVALQALNRVFHDDPIIHIISYTARPCRCCVPEAAASSRFRASNAVQQYCCTDVRRLLCVSVKSVPISKDKLVKFNFHVTCFAALPQSIVSLYRCT